jgi:hypothetical protein
MTVSLNSEWKFGSSVIIPYTQIMDLQRCDCCDVEESIAIRKKIEIRLSLPGNRRRDRLCHNGWTIQHVC